MEANIKSGDTHRGVDPFEIGGVTFGSEVSWTSLIKKRLENIEANRALQDQWMADFGITGLSETALDETIKVKAEKQAALIAAINAGYFAAGQMTIPSFQQIISGNTSVDHTQLDNYVSSDLSVASSIRVLYDFE